MEMMIGIGVFILTLLALYGGHYLVKKIWKPEQRQLHKRLKVLSMQDQGRETVNIVKKKVLSEIPWLNEVLRRTSVAARFERVHGQAGVSNPPGFFIILSALLFFAGVLAGLLFKIGFFVVLIPSLLLAAAPFLYLLQKRSGRMKKFERQLPEALELVARSLKAGHAFTGGLRLVAEEFGDPIGTEFGKTLDEINFGVGVAEALTNLTQRIDCEDLKFFVVSVIIQRETGGNLAEILDSLGRLIRERFKFQGRVRVLAGEGKLSAIVLVALPVLIGLFLSLFRGEYIKILFTDHIGRSFVLIAVVLMVCGVHVMRKMVSIKI